MVNKANLSRPGYIEARNSKLVKLLNGKFIIETPSGKRLTQKYTMDTIYSYDKKHLKTIHNTICALFRDIEADKVPYFFI